MEHLNPAKMRIMLKTYASRVAAGAVISAALTAGSLGLTAAAASSCPNPNCVRGVPPVAQAMECSEPKCLSGTDPAAAPRPGSRFTGRTGHGGPGARAAGGAGTAASAAWVHAGASTAITCPWYPPDCPDFGQASAQVSGWR